jgi:hypothetical protein
MFARRTWAEKNGTQPLPSMLQRGRRPWPKAKIATRRVKAFEESVFRPMYAPRHAGAGGARGTRPEPRLWWGVEMSRNQEDSTPEATIQGAVLNRLGDVPHRNCRLGIKVGNGASDLQYPVVGACAQTLLLHCPLQQTFGFR